MIKQTMILPLAMMLLLVNGAFAQKSESQLRTVHGAVVDKQDNPLASSVVYLKNLQTRMVKTYIVNDDGHYRFSGLDANVDYEIHAEYGDLVSSTHTISNLKARNEIVINLKVDKKKSGK